jgi:hypothetical protein
MTSVQFVFFAETKSLNPREIARTRMYVLGELLDMQEKVYEREKAKKGSPPPIRWEAGRPERMSMTLLHGISANMYLTGAFSLPLFVVGEAEGKGPKASVSMSVFTKDTKLRCPY